MSAARTPKPITHVWAYVPSAPGDLWWDMQRAMAEQGWTFGAPVSIVRNGHRWHLPCCMEIGAEP